MQRLNLIQLQNKLLYGALLIIAGSLVVIGLGPGLFSYAGIDTSWQYIFFEKLCHQDPIRSYSINQISMAVCARCLGIYVAFFAGLILLPFINVILGLNKKWKTSFVILAIALNGVDIGANALQFWQNTTESRLLLGIVFGFSIAVLIGNEFIKKNTKSEDTYGTEFAT